MKNALFFLVAFISIVTLSCKTTSTSDKVRIAETKNELKSKKGIVDNDVALFLVKIADARMMGTMEGQLAVRKGTGEAIKNYGQLMVNDQAILLAKIKKLAGSRQITLPVGISDDKKDGYSQLKDKEGNSFDKKFISMMKIDHERDIKDFKKATELKDDGIRQFVTENLPLIESHLEQLKLLKD